MKDRPAPSLVLLHLLSLCATALVAGEIWREEHNTLHDNARWVSTKVGLAKGVIGGVATVTTRTALHRNRLNLGSWHGFQEFLYRERLDLHELEFDFELAPDSWMVLRLDDGQRMLGVRFSRQAGFPSMVFEATPAGEFSDRWVFDPGTHAEGWRRARVERSADGELAFWLDGRELGRIAGPQGPVRFGFRGSFAESWLDRVRVRSADSQQLVQEDFSSDRGRWLPFVLFTLLGGALHAAFMAILSRRGTSSATRRWRLSLRLSLLSLALAGLVFGVVYRWMAGRYPDDVDFRDYKTNIEFEDEILPKLRDQYGESTPPDVTRILFIGSSQTWGAGVERAEQAYPHRIEVALNEGAGGKRYECINSGISGARVGGLYEFFEEEWSRWLPEVVVIDLSYNDRNISDQFAAGVRDFVQLAGSIDARVLLITEPAAPGFEHEGLNQNHQSLRAIAEEAGVALIEMQRVLDERADTGFLWWDSVHLTSLGHRLFAQTLLPELRRLLE